MKLIIAICLVLAVPASFAGAETLYSQDFSSGNSSLEAWTSVWGFNTVDATSGDMVLTGDNALVIDGVPAVTNLAGTSIRTQIAFEGPTASGIALLANSDPIALTAYQAGYSPNTSALYIGWNSPPYQRFAVENVDFDLTGGDELILQFDVFESKLELWAWRPGEPMPIEPQLTYVDESVNLSPGSPGVLFDAQGSTSSATYQFIRVDNTPIAETTPIAGDFDGDGLLTAADIDALSADVRAALNTKSFDLTGDNLVNADDRSKWIGELKQTYLGDADLDGEFNSADLVAVLAAGQYEDDVLGNSGWTSGDWNGDGDFTSGDLVVALADGGYEQGLRAAVSVVPEPAAFVMLMVGLIGIAIRRRHVGP